MKNKIPRRSIRLKNYDYSWDGAYFITICSENRACLFGEIVEEESILNTLGCIVDTEWRKTEVIRPYTSIDTYMVMPNHFHAILLIHSNKMQDEHDFKSRKFGGSVAKTVSSIIGQFKAKKTKLIRKTMADANLIVWQRNYYERVIRTEQELNDTRIYIAQNPVKWAVDEENPEKE